MIALGVMNDSSNFVNINKKMERRSNLSHNSVDEGKYSLAGSTVGLRARSAGSDNGSHAEDSEIGQGRLGQASLQDYGHRGSRKLENEDEFFAEPIGMNPNVARLRTNTYSHSYNEGYETTPSHYDAVEEPRDARVTRVAKGDRVAHIRFDTERTKFDNSSPPGFAPRRRSQSQGQLGNRPNLYELGLDLEEDEDYNDRLNGIIPAALLADEDDADIKGRKFASSFHTFGADSKFLDSLHVQNGLLEQDTITAALPSLERARIQGASAIGRDRAGSDFGRYYSSEMNRQPAGYVPEIEKPRLKSPLGLYNESGDVLQGKLEALSLRRSPIDDLHQRDQYYAHARMQNNLSRNSGLIDQSSSSYRGGSPQQFNDFQGFGGINQGSGGLGLYPGATDFANAAYGMDKVKRQAAGSNQGDWVCTSCGNTNYSWRHVCNMRKCRAAKPGHLNLEPPPPGSWACTSCGNLNYAERMVCNMRKCRAPRPTPGMTMGGIPNVNPNLSHLGVGGIYGHNQMMGSMSSGAYSPMSSRSGYLDGLASRQMTPTPSQMYEGGSPTYQMQSGYSDGINVDHQVNGHNNYA